MKRLIAIALTIFLALVLYLFKDLIPKIYFNAGQKAYLEKDYQKAHDSLKMALKFAKRDKDYRYYYVQTLVKLPPTLEIQKELFEFSELNYPDSADLIADLKIASWRNNIMFNAGENYIEQAPFDNKILRWDVSKFPLKINISTDSGAVIQPYYNQEIMKAFHQWQISTGNFLHFKYVSDAKDADIVIDFVPNNQENKCEEEECKYVVAYTTPEVAGDLLEKMVITFYSKSNDNRNFSPREVYNTALHEIGHALGVMGHSYNKSDLMYMVASPEDAYSKYKREFQLISPVDLNTMELLYKLIPDITNTPLSEYNSKKQFYSPIVLGNQKQISSRKVLEAQNYIKNAPQLASGYIDLAAAYAQMGAYSSAVECLRKAEQLCSNDEERFVVYYNFSVVYTETQDLESALRYAQMAKNIHSSEDVEGLIAMINFKKGDRESSKQAFISSVESNPGNITNSLNLAIIYIKEFNLIQAGKTLNRLVEVNPEAKNDPRVKVYSVLMFLFK